MRRAFLAAVAAILLLSGGRARAAESAPRNFGVVVRDGIYRGGQPGEKQLEYLRDLGVRTIVKLNHRQLGQERVLAARLGMKLVSLPLDPSSVGEKPSCAVVAEAIALLSDRSSWPVYVHCSHGRDRTGFVVGAYRQLLERRPWPSVSEELASFGHDGSMRRAYPQISRELENGVPSCRAEIARALAGRQLPQPDAEGAVRETPAPR